MKTLLTFIALIALASTTFALPPLSRQGVGVIASIEPSKKRFFWLQVENGKEFQLTWHGHTKFFLNGQQSSAAALRVGQKVQVNYRTPFFGSRSAERIIILSPKSTMKGLSK